MTNTTATQERVIDKIRGLLAKAEATEFEAEAAAFLDKASELMAKHRVDEALLAIEGKAAADPVGLLHVDITNYKTVKGNLAVSLALSFDSHVRWAGKKRLVFVGHQSDLDMIESLMTSLELQLDRELLKVKGWDGGDTKARRNSFARGWVSRVSRRIKDHYAGKEAGNRADIGQGRVSSGNARALTS